MADYEIRAGLDAIAKAITAHAEAQARVAKAMEEANKISVAKNQGRIR